MLQRFSKLFSICEKVDFGKKKLFGQPKDLLHFLCSMMATYTTKGESFGKHAQVTVDAEGLTINCGGRHIVWQASFIHKKIERKAANYVFQFGDSPIETLETSDKLLVTLFLRRCRSVQQTH